RAIGGGIDETKRIVAFAGAIGPDAQMHEQLVAEDLDGAGLLAVIDAVGTDASGLSLHAAQIDIALAGIDQARATAVARCRREYAPADPDPPAIGGIHEQAIPCRCTIHGVAAHRGVATPREHIATAGDAAVAVHRTVRDSHSIA